MTQLIRALSEQAATVNPSPPAVAIESAAVDRAPAASAPAPVSNPSPAERTASEQPLLDALRASAQQIESYLKSIGRELRFSIDDMTGETVVTVRDAVSGDVIRQIPNAEALRLAQSLGNQPNALIDISI
ncbi:MAG: flagellar protein FlaG [Gammaproteobacteria bacterium]